MGSGWDRDGIGLGSGWDRDWIGLRSGWDWDLFEIRSSWDRDGVEIRWGKEWQGSWSTASGEWEKQENLWVRQELNYTPERDKRMFWMSYDDLIVFFNKFYIGHVFASGWYKKVLRDAWVGPTAGGRTGPADGDGRRFCSQAVRQTDRLSVRQQSAADSIAL
ncbi:hypothetical protein CBR_g23251 [Chara braunii]|uniref:Calpain catalytic domain-containing protein n=1 Tax=Chara braunii TaxID=69332 RepID=A0A388JVA6_CHABU|nr:hypothetical protein CBR_g23251 [Chara braunii]|eukprot:GBG61736.1 hypothetical protein CBR_g23251 [Chara braunii]